LSPYHLFLSLCQPPPRSTLFPYTTLFRSEDDQSAAREPLAPVVVGVALEREGDPPRHEGTEALAGGAGEVDPDRVIGQPLTAPRSEEHTSELQSRFDLVCRLLLEKKKAYK